MAIRGALQQRGDTCFAINLTRHRREDHDGLYFPHSAAAVLRQIAALRPDIIHQHIGGDLHTRLLLLGTLCSLMPGAKTVLTFHSGGYPSSDEGQRIGPAHSKARMMRRYDRVIAVNTEIRDFFLRCGVSPKRIHLISPYSGVPLHDGPLPDPLEQFLRGHDPLLMTVGLLEPEYDLPLQIELLGEVHATHPRAGLLIVGSGSLEEELRGAIAAKPWCEHILLSGDLEHEMTAAALARADVFLRTTLYDGDALSVREALELGVPVVGTRTILRPEGVRLVEIGDRPGILRAVLECLQGIHARQPSPAAGKQNIEAVLCVYDEVLRP